MTCAHCGKPLGTGSLLDEFPEPPKPSTTIHRLYQVVGADVDPMEVPSEVWTAVIDPGQWAAWAARFRCLACAEAVPS